MPKKSKKGRQQFGYKTLYNLLGYTFTNTDLLAEALTRQSAIQEEVPNAAARDYQVLEFLGDRVLNCTALNLLIKQYPLETEEFLTKLLEQIISNKKLLPILGQQLNLDQFVIRGSSEYKLTEKMYADAVEAIFGAVCLDGGFHSAEKVVSDLIAPHLELINFKKISFNEVSSAKAAEEHQLEAVGVDVQSLAAEACAEFDPYTNNDSHFDSGSYEFKARVASWGLETLRAPLVELKSSEGLKPKYNRWSHDKYFLGFLPLILEEARANLCSGLEMVERGEIKPIPLRVKKFKLAKREKNRSLLELYSEANLPDELHMSTVGVLLKSKTKDTNYELLAIADPGDANIEDELQLPVRSIKARFIAPEPIWLEIDEDGFEEEDSWDLYVLSPLVSQMRMYDACKSCPDFPFRSEVLTGQIASTQDKQDISYAGLDCLNPPQQKAVSDFLRLDVGLQLVQGPPGTGKTTTIVALLNQLTQQGQRTIVCAPSNKAIHVLAERYIRDNPKSCVAIVGVASKLPGHLQSHFIHGWGNRRSKKLEKIRRDFLRSTQVDKGQFKFDKVNCLRLLKELQLELEQLHLHIPDLVDLVKSINISEVFTRSVEFQKNSLIIRKLIIDVVAGIKRILAKLAILNQRVSKTNPGTEIEKILLDRAQVIFSTLTVAGRKSLYEMRQVDVLIIDEAGQALEAETLIPFRLKPKKCLLVGDTKQLPATVCSQNAVKLNFHWSLLFRLIEKCNQPFGVLTIQYRMHPEIRQWPSEMFYEGRLEDDSSVIQKTRDWAHLYEGPVMPCVFFNVDGVESSTGTSYLNMQEAQHIVDMVDYLNKRGFDVLSRLGIITFYSGQVRCLQDSLKRRNHKYEGIKISSVDGFQGDEKDCIIVSFVRANEKGRIGFLREFERLNVAVTRARLSLMMFGHIGTLTQKKSFLFDLCHHLKGRNLVRDGGSIPQEGKQKTKKLCLFFAKGYCRNKTQCKFSHAQDFFKVIMQPRLIELKGLMDVIHYQFGDTRYLIQALTRQSAIEERISLASDRDNTNLKMLGDKLIKLALTIYVFTQINNLSLSPLGLHSLEENFFINDSILGEVGKKLGLENYVIKGQGELELTPKMYSDAFKALVGAIYLDSGDFNIIHQTVTSLMKDIVTPVVESLLGDQPLVMKNG